MSIIQAVITEDARRYWPQLFGGLVGYLTSDTTFPGSGNPTILGDVAIVRGDTVEIVTVGTGSISSSGSTVTGVGTAFTSQLRVGDAITASGQTQIVINVASDTSLTTYQAFTPVLTGAGFNVTVLYRTVTVNGAATTGTNRYVLRVSSGEVVGLDQGTNVLRVRNYNVAPVIGSFKVGEGGWVDAGSGPVPRVPDPTLRRLDDNVQDIDAIVDDTRAVADERYPLDSRSYYEKQLDITDFQFIAPTTLRVRCQLDPTEYNDDGFGNDPEIWEIGLFSEHPLVPGLELMVAYGTFPRQTKNNAVTITDYVDLVF